MARESTAVVGSGISILREQQQVPRVNGSNTVLANYEDVNSLLGVVQNSGLSITNDAVHLTGPGSRMTQRRKIIIQNLGSDNLFIGDTNVTTSNGIQISSGLLLELNVLSYGDIYGISAGTSDVRILEMR